MPVKPGETIMALHDPHGSTLALAATQEGVPLRVATSFSIDCSDTFTKDVLVRKLAAVETLGSASVICSSKTGTRTEDRTTLAICGQKVRRMMSKAGASTPPWATLCTRHQQEDRLQREHRPGVQACLGDPISSSRKMMLAITDVSGRGELCQGRMPLSEHDRQVSVCKGGPIFILDFCTEQLTRNDTTAALTSGDKNAVWGVGGGYANRDALL